MYGSYGLRRRFSLILRVFIYLKENGGREFRDIGFRKNSKF